MNKEFSLAMAVSQVADEKPTWDMARKFADAANRFEHGAVACRVMAGIALLDLRETYGTNQGARTDLGTSGHDVEKLNWPELVGRELGISDKTAGRWMKMAEAAMPRLQAGEAGEVFRQLLQTPVTQLTDKQNKALTQAVEKLVDGRSQLDFMESLGLIAPAGPKGGDREWSAFLKEKYPGLIVDGKIPKRGAAAKDVPGILDDFSAWLNARLKPRTAAQKKETAVALVREIEDLLSAAIRSPYLPLLEPQDFVGVEAATRLWSDRIKTLTARK